MEEAGAIFADYLPYAVAFGLEDSWIEKFRNVEAPPPTWWIPWGWPRRLLRHGTNDQRRGGGGTFSTGMPGGVPSEGGGSMPTLSDASRGMGQSLSGMSAGLGTMLSQALTDADQRPGLQRQVGRRLRRV